MWYTDCTQPCPTTRPGNKRRRFENEVSKEYGRIGVDWAWLPGWNVPWDLAIHRPCARTFRKPPGKHTGTARRNGSRGGELESHEVPEGKVKDIFAEAKDKTRRWSSSDTTLRRTEKGQREGAPQRPMAKLNEVADHLSNRRSELKSKMEALCKGGEQTARKP